MIQILTRSGDSSPGLNPRIARDQRLSQSQREALLKYASEDPRAGVKGLDSNMRPVVHCKMPTAQKPSYWAIARNGDPKQPSRRRNGTLQLTEVWS